MIPIAAGAALRVTNADVARCAASLKVEEAALRAVMSVESRASGFDSSKRPIILFEPHKFYAALTAQKRAAAVSRGLAYPHWGERPYPKTNEGNYERLNAARDIDEEAAFRSVSIGLGQIMGGNFKQAGCPSAAVMFDQACQSEGAQLTHMANYLKATGTDVKLRKRDWRGVARGYNGSGQVEKYAGMLARAFGKWSHTLKTPAVALVDPSAEIDNHIGDDEYFNTGNPVVLETPDVVTTDDLRKAGSRTIKGGDAVQQGLGGLGAMLATASGLASQAQDARGQVQSVVDAVKGNADLLPALTGHWQGFVIVAALAGAVYFAWRIWSGASQAKAARVDDANSGVNVGR